MLATIIAVLLNIVLPKTRVEKKEEKKRDLEIEKDLKRVHGEK